MTSCALIVVRPGGAAPAPLDPVALAVPTSADPRPADIIVVQPKLDASAALWDEAVASTRTTPGGDASADLHARATTAARDATPDGDAAAPLRVRAAAADVPVRSIAIPVDAGFAAACNAGAAAADSSARYLLFLAADVQPRAGSLTALLRCVERSPRAAAAGSLLLVARDTVLQAGLVIDQDRSPRPLYAGFPAGLPAIHRTRRLRLLSAASLLVRRDAFEAAGGFDTAFAAEEAAMDLCLRLGERGLAIYGCHESVADCPPAGPRYGDADSGESPAAQARSQRLFRTRWIDALRPDDVEQYLADRLLRVGYAPGDVPRLTVAPPLALGSASAGASASVGTSASADGDAVVQALATRAQQVHSLLEENTRLTERVASLTAALRVAHAGSAQAGSARAGSAQAASAPQSAATPSSVPGATDGVHREPEAPHPSDGLALSVGGEFIKTGEEFLTYFIEIGGLRPTDRVLDVGCGVGRMAVPLTRYLAPEGGYDGFDVMANAIDWCQAHITPRFPTFRFRHVALRNGTYNPTAGTPSTGFTFPYPANTFDFVLLTSVFTHLLPDEVRHYLAEIRKVLKPGGRLFSTFFLMNHESEALIHAGLSPTFHFAHRRDGYRILYENAPEAAVAYDEWRVRAWYEEAGFTIPAPIRYGFWCGRLDGLSLQDIVLATPSATPPVTTSAATSATTT